MQTISRVREINYRILELKAYYIVLGGAKHMIGLGLQFIQVIGDYSPEIIIYDHLASLKNVVQENITPILMR